MQPLSSIQEWLNRRPLVADALLMLFALGIGVASFGEDVQEVDDRPLDALAVGLVIVGTLPVLARRTRPVLTLLVSSVAGMSYWIYDYPGAGSSIAMTILCYSLVLYAQPRRRMLQVSAAFFVALTAVLIAGLLYHEEEEVTPLLLVMNLVIFATAWLAADAVRNRRLHLEQLEARAEQAEAEQEALAERAVADERTRIARELHDVVAHSMSVMVVQAEAANRVIGKNDDLAREATSAIASAGRESLADMRRMLGVLRDDDDSERQPAPDLSGIDALADQCRSAGLAVDVDIVGEPRPVPASVGLSAYRIVQESLTNTLRHGGNKASAKVGLTYAPEGLSIAVVDDGRGAAASESEKTVGSQHGLIGMRERIETFGGTFEAGPRVGGGFEVRAHIPNTAS